MKTTVSIEENNQAAVRELFGQTLDQMRDGDVEFSLTSFQEFIADYPADAWLADFRSYGGVSDDPEEVLAGLLALAQRTWE